MCEEFLRCVVQVTGVTDNSFFEYNCPEDTPPPLPPIGGGPYGGPIPENGGRTLRVMSSGIMMGNNIICPADTVLFPHHNERFYRLFHGIPVPEFIDQHQKIAVRVNHVQGGCKDVEFQANLIAVDPLYNLAVLEVVNHVNENKEKPPLNLCGCFKFSEKRACRGDKVKVVSFKNGAMCVYDNVVACHEPYKHKLFTQTLVLKLAMDHCIVAGSAIIDECGCVIGIVAGRHNGCIYGYSGDILSKLLSIARLGPCDKEAGKHICRITGAFGKISIIRHGYVGIVLETGYGYTQLEEHEGLLATGVDYTTFPGVDQTLPLYAVVKKVRINGTEFIVGHDCGELGIWALSAHIIAGDKITFYYYESTDTTEKIKKLTITAVLMPYEQMFKSERIGHSGHEIQLGPDMFPHNELYNAPDISCYHDVAAHFGAVGGPLLL